MFSFCKIGGLARVFCSALQLDTRQRQVGRFDTQPQPTWEVWYPGGPFSRRDRAVWYLFVARPQVWYPPSGESRGLVPAKAFRANRDQAFLRASGTKSPKLTEIGVPNLEFRQNSGWKPNRGTKPPTLADGTQMKRGRTAALLPREGGYGGADYGEGGAHEDDPT